MFGSLLNFGVDLFFLSFVYAFLKFAFPSDNELYHWQPVEYLIVGPRNKYMVGATTAAV